MIRDLCSQLGVKCAVSTHVVDGGAGATELAAALVDALRHTPRFRFTYEADAPLTTKIEAVARKVYGADGVDFTETAARDLRTFEKHGYGTLPVVIAKTHLSISHDPKLKGAPTGWRLPVREVRLAAGAGYVYAIAGNMRTMPGLGASPAAERIHLDGNGKVVGLF